MSTGLSPQQWLLEEPNYYRLLYKIAATKVNRALELDESPPRETSDGGPAALMAEGFRTATELLTYVVDTLSRYRLEREHARWWRVWAKRLTSREERIFSLLERTVLPCTELLIAATLLHSGQIEEAESHVEPIREATLTRTLSYRVYYNLACYTVGLAKSNDPSSKGVEETLRQALVFLRQGFKLARDPRKAQLVEWARGDPSLEFLRSHSLLKPEFVALLARYEVPSQPKMPDKKTSGPVDGF